MISIQSKIVGPSGSGKSTLLNTLACRLDVNTIVQGEMRLNGAPYDNAELKRIAGYVMQDDLLNGCLTVEEVMSDLGLLHVRDVMIGTAMKKGISGGERKRLCVGMQLLNRPQLLFLDETTSGLDSVTALDLLRTFNLLAHGKSQEKAVTIVCSIHQPQSKIFNLFDSLILLKAGNVVYQGPRKLAMVRITFKAMLERFVVHFCLSGRISSSWLSMSIVYQSSRSSTGCYYTIEEYRRNGRCTIDCCQRTRYHH